MPVITTDILLEGQRRDDVLEWLSKAENHARLVEAAFTGVKANGPGDWTVTFQAGLLPRTMGYRFERVDQEHGGRRVHVHTSGKRVDGTLHYSLRTMKPSTNTLVTLHHDYSSGGPLGAMLDASGIRAGLEKAWRAVLEQVKREVIASGG